MARALPRTALGTAPVIYSEAYKRSVTLLLMLAYTFNAADRTVIAIISQPMKESLHLTDTELGLLGGTAFAALYAFSGLPIARLAERFNRVAILSVALTVWSGLTALCASATHFAQLLALRVGVGVGEAGCTPAAHSLLCDYIEPARRSSALSLYSCGLSLGYILSAIVGGYMAEHHGWRSAFLTVGLPGLLAALLIRQFIQEPPRGNAEPRPAMRDPASARPPVDGASRPFSLWSELAALGDVARSLLLRWPLANIVAGVIISTFATQGMWAFIPALLNRAFGLDYATIGVVAGLTGGVAVGVGLLAGGFVTDGLGARSVKWYALVPAAGLAVCAPLYALAFLQQDWKQSASMLAIGGFFQYMSFGPTFGIIQNCVGTEQRATATALIYVLLNVIALGGGPPLTGKLIDRFAEFNFHHPQIHGVAASFDAMLAGPQVAGDAFRRACAGAGPAGAARPPPACMPSLALASRQGILITVLFQAWAAVHYLLGAIGLEKILRPIRVG